MSFHAWNYFVQITFTFYMLPPPALSSYTNLAMEIFTFCRWGNPIKEKNSEQCKEGEYSTYSIARVWKNCINSLNEATPLHILAFFVTVFSLIKQRPYLFMETPVWFEPCGLFQPLATTTQKSSYQKYWPDGRKQNSIYTFSFWPYKTRGNPIQ